MPARDEDVLLLNVRGQVAMVPVEVLQRCPDSLLATLRPDSDFYRPDSGQYCFNRNPAIFHSVLDYLETGELHVPRNHCCRAVNNEMAFWKIPVKAIEPCCQQVYTSEEWNRESYRAAYHEMVQTFCYKGREKLWSRRQASTIRRGIWNFLEEPQSSLAARIWSSIIIGVILVSVTTICLDTLPGMRQGPVDLHRQMKNVTEGRVLYLLTHTRPRLALLVLHIVTSAILTVDLLLRFIVSPSKPAFCKSWLNLNDAISLLPAWAHTFALLITDYEFNSSSMAAATSRHTSTAWNQAMYALLVLRTFRVFAVFRIAKLVRYKMLRVIMLTMRASLRELILVLVLVLIMLVVFANAIFWAELMSTGGDDFGTVPNAMWWTIVTLTTIGYGDVVPTTVGGKVVAGLCAVCGILIVGLPIPILSNNFAKYHHIAASLHSHEKKMTTREMVSREKWSQEGDQSAGMPVETYRPIKESQFVYGSSTTT